jgi:hypothetical protein
MPSPRVLDLGHGQPSPIETLTSSFAKKWGENQIAERDADALRGIYEQFQDDAGNIQGQIKAIQTNPNIGPTAKTNSIDQLLKMDHYNNERLKTTAKQLQDQAKQTANDEIIADLEVKRGLEPGSLSAYRNNPKLAEQISRPKTESKKTQASQPIDEEQRKNIKAVKEDPRWKTANLTEKKTLLDEGKVSKENSKEILQIEKDQRDIEIAEANKNEKTQLLHHKETAKYDEELAKGAKGAKNQLEAIKDVEKALKSPTVKPSSLAAIFKGFGVIGDKISKALQSGQQATISASIPAFLEGRKELFGVRLSDADLAILQDKLPDIGNSPEANKAILRLMKKYSEASVLRHQIGADIKKANKGLRPLGYADQIEEQFDKLNKQVRVRDSATGEEINIPAYKLSGALRSGMELINE